MPPPRESRKTGRPLGSMEAGTKLAKWTGQYLVGGKVPRLFGDESSYHSVQMQYLQFIELISHLMTVINLNEFIMNLMKVALRYFQHILL